MNMTFDRSKYFGFTFSFTFFNKGRVDLLCRRL